MSDFFENLMNRFKENIKEETREQIKLRYKEAIKKAEVTDTKDIFDSLCNKYQNLLLLPLNEDLKDIIVDSFALVIRIQKEKARY